MQPRRILIIAPSSFPVQHAEAIVNIKLIKALADSGKFVIDVISQNNPDYINYSSDGLDEYQLNIRSIKVFEKKDDLVIIDKLNSLLKTLFTTTHFWRMSVWALNAYKYGMTLCSEEKYDYILTKDQDSFLVGALLKEKFNIPLVATWNDPYPEGYYPYPYTPKLSTLKKFENKILEKIIRNYVDVNVFPNRRLRDYMLGKIKLKMDRTLIIPHVINAVNEKKYDINRKSLSLVCAGNNRYPRDPRNLIKAVKILNNENPEISIKLTFIGPLDEDIRDLIRQEKLEDIIFIENSVSYNKSLELIKNFDVAIVLEANCNEGIFLPTKVGDYMQLGVKLMALSPTVGVLNDLYNDRYIDFFCEVNSIDSIKMGILKAWNERNMKRSTEVPIDFLEGSVVDKYYNLKCSPCSQ